MPAWPLLLATIAAMLGLAWPTHRLVERPLSRAIRRSLTAGLEQLRSADLAERIAGLSPSGPAARTGSHERPAS